MKIGKYSEQLALNTQEESGLHDIIHIDLKTVKALDGLKQNQTSVGLLSHFPACTLTVSQTSATGFIKKM